MSNPADVVEAYFAAVVAGDAEAVGRLFAPDAEFVSAGAVLRGAAAITRMYEAGFAAGAVTPSPGPLVVDGERVAVEIAVDAGGKHLALGDFFTIREGTIHRLAIYTLTSAEASVFDDIAAAR